MNEQIKSRLTRLFEYLREVKNRTEKLVRHVSEYQTVWWLEDLKDIPGVKVNVEEDILVVQRPKIQPVPVLPKGLGDLVAWGDEMDQPPVWIADDRYLATKELFESWLESEWQPWLDEHSHLIPLKKLYDELFFLYNQLQDEGDIWEIVCGYGLLQWEVDGDKIERHVAVTPIEIHFHAEHGVFHLTPTSKGTIVETDVFTQVPVPHIAHLHELIKREEEKCDPRQLEEIERFFSELVHSLSSDGEYNHTWSGEKVSGTTPLLSYSPALIVRKVDGRIWQQELEEAMKYVANGAEIPAVLQKLVTFDEIQVKSNQIENWTSVGTELLFPLPYNEQQKEIAHRIATHGALIVQGPPGTGKSHTIANLICHLLAHGKRVLVTSEKERALEVLTEMIPTEIRSLCVSVLGGDAKSVQELEQSIRMIAESLESKSVNGLQSKIDKCKRELLVTRQIKDRLRSEMSKSAVAEHETKQMGSYTFRPLTAIQWLKEHPEHNWFPDELQPHADFPLKKEDVQRLAHFINHVPKEDRFALVHHRPSSKQIPTPSQMARVTTECTQLTIEMESQNELIKGWKVSSSFSHLLPIAKKKLEAAYDEFREISINPWKLSIFKDVLMGGERKHLWEDLVIDFEERLYTLSQLDRDLIEYEILLPEGVANSVIKEDVHFILERMKEKKSIGPVFTHVTGRKFAYLFKEVTINGKPLRETADFDLTHRLLERNELRNRMVLKWNRLIEEIEGEPIAANSHRLVFYLVEKITEIKQLLSWPNRVIEPFQSTLQAFGIPLVNWVDIDWYEQTMQGLETMQKFVKWEELHGMIQKWKQTLTHGSEQPHAHESWSQLLQALREEDEQQWGQIYQEVLRLEEMEPLFKHYQEILTQLSAYSPNWMRKLMESEHSQGVLRSYEEIQDAWVWSQCRSWLDHHLAIKPLAELEAEYKIEEQREFRLIQQLVADSTWKNQLERTTELQKRSLISWLQFIKKIGKGKGKYGNKYKKEASKEMNICREAIPVWIMPIQRVIENIDLSQKPFDVVIIDESSQSNLFALSTLLRAEKTIIVGDDRQISPDPVGMDKNMNHELIDRYLYDLPQSGQFEISTSLYDTANRIIQQRVVLKEHFRSVPEIIHFSNQFMYEGQMIPLRLPLDKEVLHPPVQAVYVRAGARDEGSKATNRAEAETIVRKIAECCHDRRYQGKSMGVISLQGFEQAKLIESMLRDTIGEKEMLARRMVCGDAYRLQGDERDVVFLSMVVAPNQRIGVLAEDKHRRRFNVAASRARDQMILFHSVDLKDLHPSCARSALLEYCLNPVQKSKNNFDSELLLASQLERDVIQLLVSKGYQVIPHVQVGVLGKYLDIVIEGSRNRLAIQCDGDRDYHIDEWQSEFEHQQVLERVGWNFWRIRGSEFYHDPSKAMEPVWRRLEELKIYPSVQMDSVY